MFMTTISTLPYWITCISIFGQYFPNVCVPINYIQRHFFFSTYYIQVALDSKVFNAILRLFGALWFFPLLTICYLKKCWLLRKTDNNLGLRGKYLMDTGYFWQISFQGHWIWCLLLHFQFLSKMWDLGTLVTNIMCLDLLVFKAILR